MCFGDPVEKPPGGNASVGKTPVGFTPGGTPPDGLQVCIDSGLGGSIEPVAPLDK